MEAVTIDGVEFVKASILAKKHRYTSDYIGQLCRSRKVKAKLVGRTWYVEPASLADHKVARFTKKPSEKSLEISSNDNISRLDVHPVVTKNLARNVAVNVDTKKGNFLKRVDWKPVKYEQDESDLFPSTEKPAQKLMVDLADPEKVAVKAVTNVTKMSTEPLPEVSLSGTLRIRSLDVDFDKSLNYIDSSVDSAEDVVQAAKDEIGTESKIEEGKKITDIPFSSKPTKQAGISEVEAVYEVPLRTDYVNSNTELRFAPNRLAGKTEPVSYEESFSYWPYVLLCLSALLFATALLFVEFDVSATQSKAEKSWSFSL